MMRIEFTIKTPSETRTYIREYNVDTKEYVIADDAYMDVIHYLDTHSLTTLDEVDYDWREVQ